MIVGVTKFCHLFSGGSPNLMCMKWGDHLIESLKIDFDKASYKMFAAMSFFLFLSLMVV